MNPDRFSLRRRGNANNVDLNRDFPDQFFQMKDDLTERQPETKAIMNRIKKIVSQPLLVFMGWFFYRTRY
ncbi:putative metallocarboxypeptidase D [Helianthus annuus]|nr:putative metallocarboxypeptidase D [Helianthus annuus]KAJ0529852.1 putative metallocarboxypeptidase D [Helianthus annuus]KAJ0696727.1 putative metallocarboxypeptidase D [Helianthus annuus]KAJ0700179.1 putative metallocarboxypeptidase D [Helianthus annuus]